MGREKTSQILIFLSHVNLVKSRLFCSPKSCKIFIILARKNSQILLFFPQKLSQTLNFQQQKLGKILNFCWQNVVEFYFWGVINLVKFWFFYFLSDINSVKLRLFVHQNPVKFLFFSWRNSVKNWLFWPQKFNQILILFSILKAKMTKIKSTLTFSWKKQSNYEFLSDIYNLSN